MIKMETKKKNMVQKTIVVICGMIFIVCMVFLIKDYLDKQEAERRFQELAQNVIIEETETEEIIVETETEEPDILKELGVVFPDIELDWNVLIEENEHIYAWIHIPGTNVNYPILQHPTETDYYLDRNIDHSSGLPGCIYTQNINAKDFTDANTIIYGHNMKNGTMFKTLHKFEDSEFFQANRYMFIYTSEKVLVYEIYAGCQISNEHLLSKYNFNEAEAWNQFMTDLKEAGGSNDQIWEEMHTQENAPIVTLSTCIGGKPNNRWIVVGVLLSEKEISEVEAFKKEVSETEKLEEVLETEELLETESES